MVGLIVSGELTTAQRNIIRNARAGVYGRRWTEDKVDCVICGKTVADAARYEHAVVCDGVHKESIGTVLRDAIKKAAKKRGPKSRRASA